MTKEKFMKISSIALAVCAVYCLLQFVLWMISMGKLAPEARTPFYQDPRALLYMVETLIFGVTGYMGLYPPSRKDLFVICGAPAAIMLISFFAEGVGVSVMDVILFAIALTFPAAVVIRFVLRPKKAKGR